MEGISQLKNMQQNSQKPRDMEGFNDGLFVFILNSEALISIFP